MNYYGQNTLESYLDDLKMKQKQTIKKWIKIGKTGTVKKWIMDLTFTIDYLHTHNQAQDKILTNNIFLKTIILFQAK